MITIKKENEIKILAEGGKILGNILKKVGESAKPGVSTKFLDELAEKLILESGGVPSFKGYGDGNPFPNALCTSINHEIVHCIPSENKILKESDIIGLDIGMKWPKDKSGLFTDCAITVPVGKIDKKVYELLDVTRGALDEAINFIKPGIFVNDIGEMIEKYVDSRGDYGIVRDLVGHGVGYKVHEAPMIPNFKVYERSERLKPGMVLAIEPMINLGTHEIEFAKNGWDIVTRDGSISAHFEHTIVVTENGCKVLTNPD
ncbi:MAG TPA: type I methionyl aminopeptidase [bacterium]|jgi:methionyl aminopeptidase|nr:type I methionyl aminopeptidase [bacterium]HOG38069.1 type I methionyl aminopeptidase [bacterium]HQI03125.1 type I methionyl aminopeptidase [bacterium]